MINYTFCKLYSECGNFLVHREGLVSWGFFIFFFKIQTKSVELWMRKNVSLKNIQLTIIYTTQNKYVCTRLLALFDVLNWSLNIKVYIILKLVQFTINQLSFYFLLQFWDPLYRFEEDNPLYQNSQILAPSLKQQKNCFITLTSDFSVLWNGISTIYWICSIL